MSLVRSIGAAVDLWVSVHRPDGNYFGDEDGPGLRTRRSAARVASRQQVHLNLILATDL